MSSKASYLIISFFALVPAAKASVVTDHAGKYQFYGPGTLCDGSASAEPIGSSGLVANFVCTNPEGDAKTLVFICNESSKTCKIDRHYTQPEGTCLRNQLNLLSNGDILLEVPCYKYNVYLQKLK